MVAPVAAASKLASCRTSSMMSFSGSARTSACCCPLSRRATVRMRSSMESSCIVSCSMRSSISARSRLVGVARQGQAPAGCARWANAVRARRRSADCARSGSGCAARRPWCRNRAPGRQFRPGGCPDFRRRGCRDCRAPVHAWHRAGARWAWSDNARSAGR